MPAILPKEEVKEAKLAAKSAAEVRSFHRKRTLRGDPQRKDDIELALKRIKAAMKPLRKAIGRFPYGPQTELADKNRDIIRAASQGLQSERRKLWKMLEHPPKKQKETEE